MTAPAVEQTINLENPVADHYATWIAGNAVSWQVRALCELESILDPAVFAELNAEFEAHRPGMAFAESRLFHDYVEPFAKSRYMVEEGSAKGQHLVLCGAGPSLRAHAAEYCPDADQVWGCNSALTWLADNGHRVTHGFTVDQTPQMVAEWLSAPDVEYLCATTVHPNLADMLRERERHVRYFHNFVGIKHAPVQWGDDNGVLSALPYEDWLYCLLFPPTIRAGSGLNAVTRALDVAEFMGFDKITVLGAECSINVRATPEQIEKFRKMKLGTPKHMKWLRKHTVMHADGGSAVASEASPLTLSATIDGRFWMTKVDMAISAQWLVRMARASKGRIRIVGDGLVNALMDKDEAFLRRLPNFVLSDGTVANIPIYDTP